MVLVGVSVGCLMGRFREPPPWWKTAPLKRPIKRSKMRVGSKTQNCIFGLEHALLRFRGSVADRHRCKAGGNPEHVKYILGFVHILGYSKVQGTPLLTPCTRHLAFECGNKCVTSKRGLTNGGLNPKFSEKIGGGNPSWEIGPFRGKLEPFQGLSGPFRGRPGIGPFRGKLEPFQGLSGPFRGRPGPLPPHPTATREEQRLP